MWIIYRPYGRQYRVPTDEVTNFRALSTRKSLHSPLYGAITSKRLLETTNPRPKLTILVGKRYFWTSFHRCCVPCKVVKWKFSYTSGLILDRKWTKRCVSLESAHSRGEASLLNFWRRTVNLSRPERARKKVTTGPQRLDDTRFTTYKRRINYWTLNQCLENETSRSRISTFYLAWP